MYYTSTNMIFAQRVVVSPRNSVHKPTASPRAAPKMLPTIRSALLAMA